MRTARGRGQNQKREKCQEEIEEKRRLGWKRKEEKKNEERR
jgi:hypothetical protein